MEEGIKDLKKEKLINSTITDDPTEIGSTLLYSGDIIALRAENGKYLQRIEEGSHKASFKIYGLNFPGDISYFFMVEIIEGNKVRLRVPNKSLYFQVHDSQQFLGRRKVYIALIEDSDENNLFLVIDKSRKKATLQ